MFFISQSLIKEFFSKWGDRDHCPHRVYRCRILKDIQEDRLSWMKGRYAESQMLGCTRDGIEDDLPRKRNGQKTTDHLRIDAMVMEFRRQRRIYMTNVDEYNVQVKLRMPLNQSYGLEGHLDIFPTTMTIDNHTEMVFIDTKLAEDSNNTWGDFCWGKPEYLDTTQMMQYHTLVRHLENPLNENVLDGMPDSVKHYAKNGLIQGYYWVFGYRKGGFIPPIKVLYDGNKLAEYKENLRKTMSLVDYYDSKGWPYNPGKLCAGCPVMDCPARGGVTII